MPTLWNVPRDNADFTGRDTSLEKINRFFKQHKNGVLALVGLSGIGKTQLAKHFLHLNAGNYEIIWWFDAQQELEPQFYQFAIEWNATYLSQSEQIPFNKLSLKGIVTFMRNALRRTPHSWALVFDNVASKDAIEAYFPDVHREETQQKHILITSQNQNSWIHQEHVGIFDREEGFLFVKRNLSSEMEPEIQRLLQETSLHPFYLAKAVEHIKSHGLSIEAYLKMYNVDEKRNLTFGDSMLVSSPLKTNKEKDFLKEKLKEIKTNFPEAYSLLIFLALFNGDHLSQNLLEKFINRMKIKTDLPSILKILNQYCLIEKTEKEGHPSKVYSIHDIIRNLIMNDISLDAKTFHITESISVLLEELEKRAPQLVNFTKKHPDMIARANVLWEAAQKNNVKNYEVFKLGKILLEYHIYQTRNHMAHESLYNDLEALLEVLHDDIQELTILFSYFIDTIYVRKIYFSPEMTSKTEERLQKAYLFFKTATDYDEHLRCLYNMAQFYLFQGKIERAKEYLNKGELILPRAESLTNRNLFWYIKSWVYSEAGDYSESNRALDKFFLHFPEEQNYALKFYGMNMRAGNDSKLGKAEKALAVAKESIKGATKYFQTESNEITAEALMITAEILSKKNRLSKAEEAIRKALNIYANYFGGEGKHADQAAAHYILGTVLERKKDPKGAFNEYMKASDIYHHLYKNNIDEPNRLGELFEKIALIGITLKRTDITHEYLNLLIKDFGLENERVRRILMNLDSHNLPSTF